MVKDTEKNNINIIKDNNENKDNNSLIIPNNNTNTHNIN
jgi:hypothetical protein